MHQGVALSLLWTYLIVLVIDQSMSVTFIDPSLGEKKVDIL